MKLGLLLLQAAVFQSGFACLASSNPEVSETTLAPLVCPCALPSHDVTTMCPQFGAAGGQAVFVVTTRSPTAPVTEPICTLNFSGCQNYRLFFGGICQENGNLHSPATQHPLFCNGVHWVDAQGRVYLAIDCQTK